MYTVFSFSRFAVAGEASNFGFNSPIEAVCKMSARPVVKTSFMSAPMQEAAIMAAQDAITNFSTEQEIATAIKAKIESQYPSAWHCFVGRNFGSFVTHESSRFIYFYIGQMGICLFATA